jgi:sulfoacetaldehyde dehydrogenase
MVRAAYASGKPAYGVGAGNATMVIDETADVDQAARNSAISKTNDNGSGCSADGNLIVDASIYDRMLERLQAEGGYLVQGAERDLLRKVYWDDQGHRTPGTIARSASVVAGIAGFTIPEGKTFFVVEETQVGRAHPYSTEKLGVVMAMFKYTGFDHALDLVRQVFETGGRGHSCGIYSWDDEHIDRLALVAPVSRIMVRQVQSSSNAGTFTNGMPMTSSMGCGVWGGNITNENISLQHYMNVTWVSRPIPEDRPSDEDLFGEFYNTEIF